MSKKIVYVSVDIESDGPCPGVNSMLSLGASAFLAPEDGKRPVVEPLATFHSNIKPLPGAFPDDETMRWWDTQPDAWRATLVDRQEPQTAIDAFVEWVEGLGGKPIFVGYPAGFDFTFVYWYCHKFRGRCPFGFSGIDMKSVASVLMNRPYHKTTKKAMPNEWFPEAKHTHVALDDAIEQGLMFLNMLDAQRQLHGEILPEEYYREVLSKELLRRYDLKKDAEWAASDEAKEAIGNGAKEFHAIIDRVGQQIEVAQINEVVKWAPGVWKQIVSWALAYAKAKDENQTVQNIGIHSSFRFKDSHMHSKHGVSIRLKDGWSNQHGEYFPFASSLDVLGLPVEEL